MDRNTKIGGIVGPQVIVQAPLTDGRYRCTGYRGVPIVLPAYIVIVPVPSHAARASAERLGTALTRALEGVAASGDRTVPCGGRPFAVPGCHALSTPACQVLAVLVGDDSTTVDSVTVNQFTTWHDDLRDRLRVLPVFPAGVRPETLLPATLARLNAEFWAKSEDEVVQTVLATAGLVPEDFRIFISYRRPESGALALQLFDALTHAQFDVFLDRFGVPRAVDFQHRLEDELARKSMVLVIESYGILTSPYTRFEIDFAKAHRLGIVALHPEGGTEVPGVYDEDRERLPPSAFVGNQVPNGRPDNVDATLGVPPGHADGVLTPDALEAVVERVKAAHTAALFRRRRYLRRAMRFALRWMGAGQSQFTSTGLLEVRSEPPAPLRDYALWLTTRPPDTDDFHVTDIRCNSASGGCGAQGIVIGPAAFREVPRRRRTEWLSDRSGVLCFDEGEMLWVAADIVAGRL